MKERKKQQTTLATQKITKTTPTQTPQGGWGVGSDEPIQTLLQSYKHEIKVHFGHYTLDPKAYNL